MPRTAVAPARILVFGSINIDLVARVAEIPRPGETVLAPGYVTHFGGKGANQAVAAARASAGTEVTVAMAGRVGDDAFGRAALDNLAANGVETAAISVGPEPTGCAFIVVDETGENAITVASGANGAVTAGDLGRAFAPDDILVLQMEIPIAPALAAARSARRAGARIVWNFAPAPSDFAAADLEAVLGLCRIFVVNEHEAVAASRLLGEAADTAEAAAAALAVRHGMIVVLTAGARGAFAFMEDGGRRHVAAYPVEVVDTTGAGDTFVGVLAAELAVGSDLPTALARACLAGSLACESAGAQTGMPNRAALDAAARSTLSRT